MLFNKRIWMNAVDNGGGSGGGNPVPPASPPAPGATPQPQPPGTPPAQAVTLTREDLKQLLEDQKNAIFADLRRSGALKDSKPPKTPPADPPSDANKNTSSSQLDLQKARALDRTLVRTGLASKLSEKQYARLEREFSAESPDDVEGWVKEYFEGLGVSQPAAAPAANPSQPAQPNAQPSNARPVSDSPPPPRSNVPLEEQDLLTMSESDRKRLLDTKGLKWFTDQYTKQIGNKRFKLSS